MKKKQAPTLQPINKDIVNLIQPSGINFGKTDIIISENYGKMMIINKFDTNPDYGWLAELNNLEGTITKIHCEPTDSGTLIAQCDAQIKKLNGELNECNDESIRQSKEKAIETTKNLIRQINGSSGEGVIYCTVLLLIQAYSRELLEERVKEVKTKVTVQNHAIRNLTLYQEEGFRSISPYGMVEVELSDIGERNMPLSTLWGGFPNAASGINDGRGWFIGCTRDGNIVMVDMWKRGEDRNNSNWLITGIPGIGKSTFIKSMIINEWAMGTKIIIFDPEREYCDITNYLKGKILRCGGGGKVRTNPLQVRILPDDDENEIDKLYDDVGHGIGQLAMHFQFLRAFFKMYKKEMSDLEIDTLEIILEKLYKEKNITWDTDCSHLKPEDYPILEEMFYLIEKESSEKPQDKELQNLKKRLRSICIGADSQIWNGYTNMTLEDADILDLDTSLLIESDDNVRGGQYHNLLTWVMSQVSLDRLQKMLILIDETYLMIDPEIPLPMKCLRNYSKRFRKYESGLVIITHAVSDLLDPAIKRFGQAIIDNACYKFIMGTDGQNFAEIRNLFKLTQEEEDTITSLQRRVGILIAGASKIITEVKVRNEFLNIMGTAGGR